MFVEQLTRAAADELNDLEEGHEYVRYPLVQLFDYIYQALQQLALARPTLFHTTNVIRLAPGEVQKVPETAVKLVDVQYNVARDGTRSSAVLPGVRTLSRYFNINKCAAQDGTYRVQSASIDPSDDNRFFVTPPVPVYPAQYVEITYQKPPDKIVSLTQWIDIPSGNIEQYYNVILDWVLYRAFGKDTESVANLERSKMHYEAFYTSVLLDAGQAPKVGKQPVGRPKTRNSVA